MSKEELGRFFHEFNPDATGKVSNRETLATSFSRTVKDTPGTAATSPASVASTLCASSDRPSSRNQGAEKLRGRRQNSIRCAHGKDELGGFSSVRPFLPYRMQGATGEVTDDGEGSIASTRLLLPPGKTILALSAADGGTNAVGDAEERIDFQGFRANVERAKETAGVMDGGIQAEARTPPAMERNLFLSALANGKLEHHRDDLVITLKRVVAGGLAGMLAKSVVAPVDRVKILFQVTNEKFSFKRQHLGAAITYEVDICQECHLTNKCERRFTLTQDRGRGRGFVLYTSQDFKAEKLFHDILALEGPAGLWKGNSATLIRVFPYAGTQFMMFDSLKRWALLRKTRRDPNAEQRLSNLESLMSGSFAGAFSALVTYPLDLARARLAVGHARKLGGRRRTMGVPQLLRTVVRQDGFRALYRGVTPSLLGIIPYAGIAFSINEQAKHEVLVLTGKEPGMFHKLGIGALAGLIAQSCTYPLEVTRRRMQTHGLIDSYAGVNKVFEVPKSGVSTEAELIHRLNIFQTFKAVDISALKYLDSILCRLKAVFQEQGMRGLFKGLSMNWVKGPVGISISFTTFDFLKRQFGIS